MADEVVETLDRNAVMEMVYDRLFGEEWENRRSYWNAELKPLMSSLNKQLILLKYKDIHIPAITRFSLSLYIYIYIIYISPPRAE